MNIPIILETEFSIGEKVKHRVDSEMQYIIVKFIIDKVDTNGVVISYTIKCAAGDGEYFDLSPVEIQKATEVNY